MQHKSMQDFFTGVENELNLSHSLTEWKHLSYQAPFPLFFGYGDEWENNSKTSLFSFWLHHGTNRSCVS